MKLAAQGLEAEFLDVPKLNHGAIQVEELPSDFRIEPHTIPAGNGFTSYAQKWATACKEYILGG